VGALDAYRTNIERWFRKNNSINVDKHVFSLLDNNPRLVDFAIEHIVEKPDQYGNLFKDALRYSRIKEREAELSQLEFSQHINLLGQDGISPELVQFIVTGRKPKTEEKIGELFCNFFLITVEKGSNSGDVGYPIDELRYYQYILKGITHLDLRCLSFLSFKDKPHSFFQSLFLFLLEHYEGNSLNLGWLNFGRGSEDRCKNSVFDLIKYNAHLTKIEIGSCGNFKDYIPDFIEAFQSSRSITQLTISYCGDVETEMVVQILKKNSTLKVLTLIEISDDNLIKLAETLKDNRTLTTLQIPVPREDLAGLRAIIRMCEGLTSLMCVGDFSEMAMVSMDHMKMLLATLKENRTLTSFKFPWMARIEANQCKEHLQSNLLRYKSHLVTEFLLSSLPEPLTIPQDVIRFICTMLWTLTGTEEQPKSIVKDYL